MWFTVIDRARSSTKHGYRISVVHLALPDVHIFSPKIKCPDGAGQAESRFSRFIQRIVIFFLISLRLVVLSTNNLSPLKALSKTQING